MLHCFLHDVFLILRRIEYDGVLNLPALRQSSSSTSKGSAVIVFALPLLFSHSFGVDEAER